MRDNEIRSVNRRLNAGTDSVAAEVDERFRQRLCILVARELNEIYKKRQDPEDIVQSTFKSFYRRAEDGEFHFKHEGAIWMLLQQMVRRKMLHRIEKDCAQKRNVRRERVIREKALDAIPCGSARLLGDALELALKSEPSPFPEIYQLQLFGYSIGEVVDVVLTQLDLSYAEILQLRLQGNAVVDIAERVGLGTEVVRYRIQRISSRLQQLLNSD